MTPLFVVLKNLVYELLAPSVVIRRLLESSALIVEHPPLRPDFGPSLQGARFHLQGDSISAPKETYSWLFYSRGQKNRGAAEAVAESATDHLLSDLD